MAKAKQQRQTAEGVTLTFSAEAVPAEGAATPTRFKGIAYSGDVVPGYGWLGDVAIDLGGLRNPDGDEVVVLRDHDATIESIAGKGRIRRQADGSGAVSLSIEGELSAATEAGQQVAALFAEGFPVQMSVGITGTFRETKGEVLVNGRSLDVAGVFERPLVREVSFVAVAADPRAVAEAAFQQQEPDMTKPTDDLSARVAELEAQLAAATARADAAEALAAETRRAARSAALAALCAETGRKPPEGDAAKPYLEMTDAAFGAYAADLRQAVAAARRADPALFRATSVAMADKPAADDATARRDALFSAVKALSQH